MDLWNTYHNTCPHLITVEVTKHLETPSRMKAKQVPSTPDMDLYKYTFDLGWTCVSLLLKDLTDSDPEPSTVERLGSGTDSAFKWESSVGEPFPPLPPNLPCLAVLPPDFKPLTHQHDINQLTLTNDSFHVGCYLSTSEWLEKLPRPTILISRCILWLHERQRQVMKRIRTWGLGLSLFFPPSLQTATSLCLSTDQRNVTNCVYFCSCSCVVALLNSIPSSSATCICVSLIHPLAKADQLP